MEVRQFENKNLSHFSYAVLNEREKEIILIDPGRDIKIYLAYAKEKSATIKAVIETHAHADFVSGHLELFETTGATIYVSERLQAAYPHKTFDEGEQIVSGEITLTAINTPGHSPDSICVLLAYPQKQVALFTGDTLFIGDCGRPDLREDSAGNDTAKTLAGQLYHSLHDKIKNLPGHLTIYPAHGAGSLCGKSLGDATSGSLEEEKRTNWCLQKMTEAEFVQQLLEDQPFVPAYFSLNVAINIKGAAPFQSSLDSMRAATISGPLDAGLLQPHVWVIDTREAALFKEGHLKQSINIMAEAKFETWLGSIIEPAESFYLVASTMHDLEQMKERCAAIGYEGQILAALVVEAASEQTEALSLQHFRTKQHDYTIIDVRSKTEVADAPVFADSLVIPLNELRRRVNEIPIERPLIVHCVSGFRSAIGSSLLAVLLGEKVKVFDLGNNIKEFLKK